MNSVRSQNLSLKFEKFTTSGCKDISDWLGIYTTFIIEMSRNNFMSDLKKKMTDFEFSNLNFNLVENS